MGSLPTHRRQALRLGARSRHQASMLRVTIWLVSFAAFWGIGHWLWVSRGLISRELLQWEAQRQLVLAVRPPDLTLLLTTQAPLVFYSTLVAGSAGAAAALIGAAALASLESQLRAVHAPRLWLPLIVLQPAVLIGVMAYPTAVARAALIASVMLSFYRYLHKQETWSILTAALTLGALMLIDAGAGVLLVWFGAALVLARRRGWREQVTIVLIALFPGLFVVAAWGYLLRPEVSGQLTWQSPALVSAALDWGTLAPPRRLQDLLAGGVALLPLLLIPCAALVQQRRSQAQVQPWRHWLGSTLLLATPLADLAWQFRQGNAALVLLPLLALPALAIPLLQRRRLRWGIGALLTLGLLVGWAYPAVAAGGEAAHLLRLVREGRSDDTLAPYRALAEVLNARLAPGQRVLIDETAGWPLLALVSRRDAFLLPHQLEYRLATQDITHWAEFVVVRQPRRPDSRRNPEAEDRIYPGLSSYDLVLRSGELYLYQRLP